MRITHVQLPVPDPVAAAAFYVDVLGARADTAAGCGTGGPCATTVRLGATTLVLVEDASADPSSQHLAITVPGDAGRRAHDWLRDRVRVLPHAGRTLLEGAPSWNSQSLYFRAPDGMVLELIARRRRPHRLGASVFGPDALLGVSEVGLAVPDVPVAAARLARTFGLQLFGDAPSADFAAVGDDDGLLVLVRSGRTWFPTHDATARPVAVHVQIDGARPGSTAVNGLATVTAGPPRDAPRTPGVRRRSSVGTGA
ncbi:hypothetical protein GTR02_02610 [Kineococcus sp. R8]|uniref:VOC family protein n=1 Tax=Kineococcus siccus TaxID=2696567 RepID=UPI001412C2D0|nr:VOC family protein [Kineococcus siccus]NAZ80710.1 hypothetical protein [Kineococcus siccus]